MNEHELLQDVEEAEAPSRISSIAARKAGPPLSEEEIEAAEAEAEAWARRVNSC